MSDSLRKRRILFASIGSLGDLHPVFGLALEMKQRGHFVRIASTPFYREKAEALGMEFAPLRPAWNPTDSSLIAQFNDIRRGPEKLLREAVLPHLRDTYDDLLAAAQDVDLMIAGELVYAAPLVAEKLHLHWASGILSPCTFFSVYDPPVLPPAEELEHLRWTGPGVHRVMLQLSCAATNHWWKPVRELRRKEGLGPGIHPLLKDKFSPELTLAMFSYTLARPQRDWPGNTVQTGFVLYDKADGQEQLSEELARFLADGEPPIVFTQGSTAVFSPGRFYETSLKAAKQIGRRALLVGADSAMHPGDPDVMIVGYAPYSRVFPQCAAIVHQGGVGTTGAAMRAGRPMLIVPFGWDQPDQAARIARIGSGLRIARKHYSAERAAEALQRLIAEEKFQRKAAEVQKQMQAENGAVSACDAIEQLLAQLD